VCVCVRERERERGRENDSRNYNVTTRRRPPLFKVIVSKTDYINVSQVPQICV
jgi:hypothetical protein